jgi:outer membrane receptor protein involved in Fe transport
MRKGYTVLSLVFALSLLFFVFGNIFSEVNLNTTLSNSAPDFAIPKRPGIEFDSTPVQNSASIQSHFPTSSVQIKSYGSAGQTATAAIDGGNSEKTALGLDGVVIENAQIKPFDVSVLPIEFSQNLEIYKNNLLPYGMNASAGFVNFKLPRPEANENQLQVYGGSYENWGGKIVFSRKPEVIGFVLGGAFSSASNRFQTIDSWGATNTTSNLDYRKYSFLGKLESGPFKLSGTHTEKSGGTGTSTGRQKDFLSTLDASYQQGRQKLDASYVHWQNNYADAYSADQHLNQTIHLSAEKAFEWGFFKTIPRAINNFFIVDSTKIGHHLDDEINLVWDNVFSFDFCDIGFSINNLCRFSEGYAPIPCASLVLYPFDHFQIFSTISRQFRFPTFNELYWPEDTFSHGNSSLLPEDGLQWKTGGLILFDPFYLSLSYSETYLHNQILWIPQDNGKWEPENIRQSFCRIINAALNFEQYWEDLYCKMGLSYSWNYSINQDFGSPYYQKRIIYTPLYKIAGSIVLDYKKTGGASLTARQVSERFTTEANTAWLPPYFFMDISLNLWIFFFSVENILDAQYQEVQGYPQMGRNFRGGIDWKF